MDRLVGRRPSVRGAAHEDADMYLTLRGVTFERVFNASGARGFRREGYWFHRLGLGPDFDGATFVTKTTTLSPRAGNMPLDEEWRPQARFPDCVIVKPFKGVVLNAVGLSGPGIEALIDPWLGSLVEPSVISIMSVAPSPEERLAEVEKMVLQLERFVDVHPDRVAIQVNISCPNVGLDTSHLAHEAAAAIDAVARLDAPIMVKLNALAPSEVAVEIARHKRCDAIVVSNTIPWGQLPNRIEWMKLFGVEYVFGVLTPEGFPLAKYGGGGLSGAPLLPIVCDWIRAARAAGVEKPIIGGGGILSKRGADAMLDAGADAIELGSIAILRPWRVKGIVNHVRARFSGV
jgi:dihydroorotate dehydrogenase (NAD+) catalytic subunit